MIRPLTVSACAVVAAVTLAWTADDTPQSKETSAVPPVLNFTMNDIDAQAVNLSKYQGKVVLMVNVASQCGYTPQYTALEALHEKYADQGLAILGFPANDFGKQEPGTESEIKEFCTSKYNVKFPMFSKIVVKGEDQAPLYKFLTSTQTDPQFAGEVKWNFEKFLISRDGKIVNRFRSKITPDSDQMIKAIEAELAAKPDNKSDVGGAAKKPATQPASQPSAA